jgi:predicted transposase YbfD/YdcC
MKLSDWRFGFNNLTASTVATRIVTGTYNTDFHIEIMTASKPAKFGQPQRSINTWIFSHVGQAFVIERESIDKKTGEQTHEVVYGVTNCTPQKAHTKKVLKTNREHWGIENTCHYVLIGTTTKTAAASGQDKAPRISPGCAASLSASSNPKAPTAWHKKCAS